MKPLLGRVGVHGEATGILPRIVAVMLPGSNVTKTICVHVRAFFPAALCLLTILDPALFQLALDRILKRASQLLALLLPLVVLHAIVVHIRWHGREHHSALLCPAGLRVLLIHFPRSHRPLSVTLLIPLVIISYFCVTPFTFLVFGIGAPILARVYPAEALCTHVVTADLFASLLAVLCLAFT